MMNPKMQQLLVDDDSVIALLLAGKVGVMPTDTVYGLVAGAANPEAAARLYALKKREHKPGTVVAASVEQLISLGVPEQYLRRVQHLWPNPLSVEIPLGGNLDYLHQETGRQGFRVVSDERLRNILEQTGPLVTSSANQPGEPGSSNVHEAFGYFGDALDFYIDGGDLSGRPPSTLIGIANDGTVTVYREGAIRISSSDPIHNS
jgi:L-threonylcarbamoyladenylate synthase